LSERYWQTEEDQVVEVKWAVLHDKYELAEENEKAMTVPEHLVV
jgi:hypothetical protein